MLHGLHRLLGWDLLKHASIGWIPHRWHLTLWHGVSPSQIGRRDEQTLIFSRHTLLFCHGKLIFLFATFGFSFFWIA